MPFSFANSQKIRKMANAGKKDLSKYIQLTTFVRTFHTQKLIEK